MYKSNDSSQQVLPFCDQQKQQNVSTTSFSTSTRLTSGVDCQASYSLFFLWCRVTNDWWTWSCLHSLQRPSPTSSHSALANHPHWMSYFVQSTAWKVDVKKQQHHHRWITIPRYRKALCANFTPIFSLKNSRHVYLNCTPWF